MSVTKQFMDPIDFHNIISMEINGALGLFAHILLNSFVFSRRKKYLIFYVH